MCEPTTILAGSALALGAVSAYGQYQAGQQQARIANANADAQEIAARDTINAGNDAAYQQRQQTRASYRGSRLLPSAPAELT